MPTEREEYDAHIGRYKAAITEELVKMGVKQDAAIRAVNAQTRFGLVPSQLGGHRLHVNVGGMVRGAFGTEKECATKIRNTLPEAAFTAFDEPSSDEQSWANYEARLNGTSRQFSREELREQERQKMVERVRAGLPEKEPVGTPEEREQKRTEVSSFL